MYRLYDPEESIVLPNGKSYTGEQLRTLGGYDMLLNVPCAAKLSGGVMVSYQPLGTLAEEYGIFDEDDPSTVVDKINEQIKINSRINSLKNSTYDDILTAVQFTATTFSDEVAVTVPNLYPEYEVGHEYKKDDRFLYNHSLYKVNQDHTSQAQWVPGTSGTESLYTNLMLDESGYQIWKQPTGAHDAYNTGDIVRYPDKEGQLYKSTIDGNVYSPDAYPQGWEVYTEE